MRNFDCIVAAIRSVDWFRRVGLAEAIPTHMRVNHVPSWEEALALRGSNATSNAFLESRNMLTRELSDRFRREYRNANRVVAEVHEALEADIFPRVDAVIDSIADIHKVENGPAFVKVTVRWDLVSALMEQAYSDLVPVRFYDQVSCIYSAGHFPLRLE